MAPWMSSLSSAVESKRQFASKKAVHAGGKRKWRRRLCRTLVTAVALLQTLALTVQPALAQDEDSEFFRPPGNLIDPPEVASPINEVAPFAWWTNARYGFSWDAYNTTTHSYDDRYVNPSGFGVQFSACETPLAGERGMEEVQAFTWVIEGLDGISFYHTASTVNCVYGTQAGPPSQWPPDLGYPPPDPGQLSPGSPAIHSDPAAGESAPGAAAVPADTSSAQGAASAAPMKPPSSTADPATGPMAPVDRPGGATGPALVPPLLPEQGTYRVTLQVEFTDGSQASGSHNIRVRDYLIVSIGDSNASGQGNPDGEGDWDFFSRNDPAVWQEVRCHRSKTSGPAIAAARLEMQDPHSTVTFLSFACSGAQILEGLLGPYAGSANPQREPDLAPQIQALRSALCGNRPNCEGARQIDHLLISVGINDLQFSDVVIMCGDIETLRQFLGSFLPLVGSGACHEQPSLAGDMNMRLWQLGALYQQLDGAIRTQLTPYPRHIHITEYPVDVFYGLFLNLLRMRLDGVTLDDIERNPALLDKYLVRIDGGCGFFRHISAEEAAWLLEKGDHLNRMIYAAAKRYRWNYIGGIKAMFDGHGYCTTDYWFVEVSESLADQLDELGSLHPNRSGHLATATKLLERIQRPIAPREVTKRVEVFFEQARVSHTETTGLSSRAAVNVIVGETWHRTPTYAAEFAMPLNSWADFPNTAYYTGDVADDEEVVVFAGTAMAGAFSYATVHRYGPDNGYGLDLAFCTPLVAFRPHQREYRCRPRSSTGAQHLEVQYRVRVTDMSNTSAPMPAPDGVVTAAMQQPGLPLAQLARLTLYPEATAADSAIFPAARVLADTPLLEAVPEQHAKFIHELVDALLKN